MGDNLYDVEAYLTKYIEGYLFGDIEAIIKHVPVRQNGAAGYPIIMAVCSGIEILGTLVRGTLSQPFSDLDTAKYFGHYWKNYLAMVNPSYASHGELMRVLVRNGLAHTFATKKGIGITRHGNALHLEIHQGQLVINANCFYEDFKKSYVEIAKPLIFHGGELHDLAQQRLNELLAANDIEAERVLTQAKIVDKLIDSHNLLTRNTARASGASGATYMPKFDQ